ncbi:MAG: hypothetical protein V3U02_12540 [Calditrichia bacterium]
MNLNPETIAFIIGGLANLVAVIGAYIKIERRITRIETLLNIFLQTKKMPENLFASRELGI